MSSNRQQIAASALHFSMAPVNEEDEDDEGTLHWDEDADTDANDQIPLGPLWG